MAAKGQGTRWSSRGEYTMLMEPIRRPTGHGPSLGRRELLLGSVGAAAAWTQPSAPVVNAGEHAWVLNSKFPMSGELTVCPNLPDHEYSAEFLLSEMKTYRVDHVVISHVCYYGRDNSYPSYCVKKYPGRFA